MSTRVTSAIASRKARENLIRLLLPKNNHLAVGTGATSTSSSSAPPATPLWTDRHSHSRRKQHQQQRQGNSSSGDNAATGTNANTNQQNKRHSYSQLRALYLKKVHDMHPDKVAHKNATDAPLKEERSSNVHLEFIELKNAWEEYHASVRIIRGNRGPSQQSYDSSSQGDIFWEEDEEDNFTMFGVGCSFADSPEERDLRNTIMDQACRGWFSSGSISHLNGIEAGHEVNDEGDDGTRLLASDEGGTYDNPDTTPQQQSSIKLSDDDMFVSDDKDNDEGGETVSRRRFLVQDVNRFRRKR